MRGRLAVTCLGQIRGYLLGADKGVQADKGVINLGQMKGYLPRADKGLSAWAR